MPPLWLSVDYSNHPLIYRQNHQSDKVDRRKPLGWQNQKHSTFPWKSSIWELSLQRLKSSISNNKPNDYPGSSQLYGADESKPNEDFNGINNQKISGGSKKKRSESSKNITLKQYIAIIQRDNFLFFALGGFILVFSTGLHVKHFHHLSFSSCCRV